MVSTGWGGVVSDLETAAATSQESWPPERQEPADDRKGAELESKPLRAQTAISSKSLVLDEYLYPNRARGKVPSVSIFRVLPLLSHVDRTQESGGILAKSMFFEVQEIVRRPWARHISSYPEDRVGTPLLKTA